MIFKLWPLYSRTRNERKGGWEGLSGKWCGYRVYPIWPPACHFADGIITASTTNMVRK
jgi:hypothetical protein